MINIVILMLLAMSLGMAQSDPPPGTVEVVYSANSTNWYTEIEYTDENGDLEQLLIFDFSGSWQKTIYVKPGPWAFAAVGITSGSGGMSCKLYVDGELVQKNRDIGHKPLANCSGTIRE